MELHERIKELRKTHLDLTQEAFGNRLSISRDMVNNIERGRVDIKDHIVKLICSEFSINEEWLRNGTGEMKVRTPAGIMDQLKKEFSLDEFSSSFVYEYLKLDEGRRDAVREFFYNVLNGIDASEAAGVYADIPKTPEELEKEFPPVDIEPERKEGSGTG